MLSIMPLCGDCCDVLSSHSTPRDGLIGSSLSSLFWLSLIDRSGTPLSACAIKTLGSFSGKVVSECAELLVLVSSSVKTDLP